MPTDPLEQRQTFRERLLLHASMLADELGIDAFAVELRLGDDLTVHITPPGPDPFDDEAPVPIDDLEATDDPPRPGGIYALTIDGKTVEYHALEHESAATITEALGDVTPDGITVTVAVTPPTPYFLTAEESAVWRAAAVACMRGMGESTEAIDHADAVVAAFRSRSAPIQHRETNF